MANAKVINRQLDPAVVGQMEEPIRVTISRIIGGARSPLTLPSREDKDAGVTYAPGDGWTKDHISMLEGWLVADFAGGGLYNIKIVDTKGLAYEWQPFFDPKTFPPRIPYTMAQAASPGGGALPTMAPPSENQWPPVTPPGALLTPIATPIPSQVPMSFSPYPYGFQFGQPSTVSDDRRRHEDERRAMNEKIAQLERDRAEERHRADLAAMRADSDRKLDELKAAFTPKTDEGMTRRLDALETALTKALDRLAAPQGPNPDLLALQEQNRRLEAKLEQEAAERRHAEQIAQMERKIEAINNRPTGPDPMFTLLVDAMKDNGRNMQSVMDGMSRQMLTPQDVLNLAKSTSSGLDDLKTNVVRMFSEVFDLQKRAFETAAQMLPQGESPAVRIIEQGIEKAGAAFDNWQASKDAAQVAQAKAVTAQAKAQEAAINAQREQLAEMARREESLRTAQRNAAHVPSKVDAQLGGAPIAAPATPPGVPPGAPTAVPTNGVDGGRVIPFAKPTTDEKRLGKTDLEWFGGALEHVNRMRAGVAEFLLGISTTPPTMNADGTPIGVPPEMAAAFVIQSATTIVQQGLMVPVFTELYLTSRWDDFAMVLLPNVPHQYRAKMIQLIREHEGDGEDEDEDDEEDSDDDDDGDEGSEDSDDGDEDDDPEDATPAKGPVTAKKSQPTTRRPPRQPRA